MAEFKNLIQEIRATLKKILVFDIFIESVLIFLCIYIFLMIFNLWPIISILPALAYFIIMLYRRRNLTSIKIVEDKYPVLNEALRTANDTIREDNYVVNELRNQVRANMRHVSASSFMDIGGDTLKVVLIIGMLFLILGISICEGTNEACQKFFSAVDVQDAAKRIDIHQIYSSFLLEDKYTPDGLVSDNDYDIRTKNLLLGQNSIATLGDEKIKVRINLEADQIDIHDVSDEVTQKEFLDSELKEVYAVGDVSFKEDIPKEHKEIVKNYFNAISR